MNVSLAVALVVLVAMVAPSHQARISLFDHAGHQGHVGDQDVNGCVTLPAWQNRKVSSVNTHGQCFILYEHGNCQGARVTVANGGGNCPDHGRLSSCNWNDRTTSISRC